MVGKEKEEKEREREGERERARRSMLAPRVFAEPSKLIPSL